MAPRKRLFRGHMGEEIAAAALERMGWIVLARNHRLAGLEIAGQAGKSEGPLGLRLDDLGAMREKALRDCSDASNKFDQKTWGVTQVQTMRACMAQHGQGE